MMYDRENDNRNNEGRQVQQELEDQLRAFGDTMTGALCATALRAGAWTSATGRGGCGPRQPSMQPATASGRRQRPSGAEGVEAILRRCKAAFSAEGAADADPAGMPGWFRQIFAKPEPTPVESIRISAKKRHSAGCTCWRWASPLR
ncbi:MAG: hypothetical protein ACLVJH_15000 [Faecalibacterium prausnitzii]